MTAPSTPAPQEPHPPLPWPYDTGHSEPVAREEMPGGWGGIEATRNDELTDEQVARLRDSIWGTE